MLPDGDRKVPGESCCTTGAGAGAGGGATVTVTGAGTGAGVAVTVTVGADIGDVDGSADGAWTEPADDEHPAKANEASATSHRFLFMRLASS
jgi:hypothetical protein